MPCKVSTLENAWKALKQRCDNPKNPGYKNYGGRGIGYSDSWAKFANFYADMESTWQPGLMLERNDNDGDYCKENCRWATRLEQNRNMRRRAVPDHVVYEIREIYATQRISQASLGARYGLDQTTVSLIVLGRKRFGDI